MHGHEDCRAQEFARWPRLLLEHERNHLSKAMAAKAFLPKDEQDALLHELLDIDFYLSQLEPKAVHGAGQG